MNWAIGIDMYTLMCIKLMTNKNLCIKINKIKFKNKKSSCTCILFRDMEITNIINNKNKIEVIALDSLVAQRLRIHLQMQGTQVGALIQEDPT